MKASAKTASRRIVNKGDGYDIPDFCRIPQDKRNKSWLVNPPRVTPLLETKAEKEMDPSTVAFLRAQEERDKAKSSKEKSRLKRIIPKAELRNMRWDAGKNKFVPNMFTATGVPIQHSGAVTSRTECKDPAIANKPKKAAVDDLGASVIAHTTDGGVFNAVKLKRFAVANGVWNDKYATLNNGLQRMNIVNRLRGRIKKDGKFKVVWK